MLIVGAKGFAKEVLEVCHQNNKLENLVFQFIEMKIIDWKNYMKISFTNFIRQILVMIII